MAACYTLDLYCDNEKCPDRYPNGEYKRSPQAQYTDKYGSVCRSKARRAGWLLGKASDLCPKCSGKKRNAIREYARR